MKNFLHMEQILKFKEKCKSGLYKKLILSYLLITVIMIVSIMISHYFFKKSSIDKATMAIDEHIHYIKTVVDSKMYSIYEKVYIFLNDDVLAEEEAFHNPQDVDEIIQELLKIVSNAKTAEVCYLYTGDFDKIISSNGTESADIFDKYKLYGQDGITAELLDSVEGSQYFPATVTRENITKNVILFIFGKNFDKDSAKIILEIKEEDIKNYYHESNHENGFAFTVVNSKGHILSNSAIEKVNTQIEDSVLTNITNDNGHFIENNKLFSYEKSEMFDWYYILEADKDVVSEDADTIRNINLLILVISLLLAIFLMIYFADRYYAPVNKLIDKVKNDSVDADEKEEFDFLSEVIEWNIAEREKYQEKISFIHLIELKQIDKQLVKMLGKDILAGVVIRGIRIYEMVNRIEEYVERNNDSGVELKILGIRSDTVISFLSVDKDKEASVKNYLENLVKIIYETTFTQIYMGVGFYISNPDDLLKSIEKATYVLNYSTTVNGNNVFYYSDKKIENNTINLDYNFVQKKLNNLVSSCDVDGLRSFIKEIFDENKNISNIYKWHLSIALLDAYVSIEKDTGADLLESELLITELQNEYSMENLSMFFTEIFVFLSTVYFKEKNPEDETKRTIVEFIENNYSNPGLSIIDLAEHLKYSPPYMSVIFKKCMNQNFTQYLLAFRLEKAKELLGDPSIKIAHVAASAGFATYNNFARMFKKKYGISPGEYKNGN